MKLTNMCLRLFVTFKIKPAKQNNEGPPSGRERHWPFFVFKNSMILETLVYQFANHVKY